MIAIQDINLWLVPPMNSTLVGVRAEDGYIIATYHRPSPTPAFGVEVVEIYLNDMGREVVRATFGASSAAAPWHRSAPEPHQPLPIKRRYRFVNGFLIALQGLQEMFKCHSK